MSDPIVPTSNLDFSGPRDVKSLYEILATGTIVFANEDIETIVTITGEGYYWWFKMEDGSFSLTDVLYCSNDLKRLPIAEVRKTAEDWFNYSLGVFVETEVQSQTREEENNKNTYQNIDWKNTSFINNKPVPLVEPGFIDENKKDAHTEHCCAEHNFCWYGNKKCTVVRGQKKQSYPCRCEEY